MTPTAYGLQTVTKPGGGAPILADLFGFYAPSGSSLEAWKYTNAGAFDSVLATTTLPWTPAGLPSPFAAGQPGDGLRIRSVFLYSDPSSTAVTPVLVWDEPAQSVIALWSVGDDSFATVPLLPIGATNDQGYALCANMGDGWIYQSGLATIAATLQFYLRRFRGDGSGDAILGTQVWSFGGGFAFTDGIVSFHNSNFKSDLTGTFSATAGSTGVGLAETTMSVQIADSGGSKRGYRNAARSGSNPLLIEFVTDSAIDFWAHSAAQSGAALPNVEGTPDDDTANCGITINSANAAIGQYPWSKEVSFWRLKWIQAGVTSTAREPTTVISANGGNYPHVMHAGDISVSFP